MANRRTRELRRAAAVMAQPAPLEVDRLPSPPRVPSFPDYDMSPRRPRTYDCGHARPRGVELVGAYHGCPGCERFDRKRVRHWLILAVAAAILLTVTCTARGAEEPDTCMMYRPRPGERCRPPTVAGHIHTVRVCYCSQPKIAGVGR